MALLVPDVGEDFLITVMVGKRAQEDFVLRLNTNNVTPGESDTNASYTEAAGNGYSAITLTKTSWSNTSSGTASYAQQTFTFSGALGNVYGYYITPASNTGIVLWAEKFSDGPYNIQNNGDQIKITPTITLS